MPVGEDDARTAAAQWLDQTSPGKLPEEDGWVADWGIWGDNSDSKAREIYQSIPLDLALRYEFGKPQREMVIFTDPNGQNDRRLMAMLSDAGASLNAVVYVFPLQADLVIGNVPRILCTSKPAAAWLDWMRRVAPEKNELGNVATPRIPEDQALISWGEWEVVNPEISGCEGSSIASRIDVLASELGVSHSPTVIFANGRAWPSPYITKEDLNATWTYVHGRLDLPISDLRLQRQQKPHAER